MARSAKAYELGRGITAPARPVPYRREITEPARRPLRVFTQDPGFSRFDGAVAMLRVAWEPSTVGPCGALFAVRDLHDPSGTILAPLDLDHRNVLTEQGLAPSTHDPRFAQQMTYAVAMVTYERFWQALGRLPEFAPSIAERADSRIELRPHFNNDDNAYYMPSEAAICFGVVKSGAHSAGRTQTGAHVFTSLSHDVIAHEVAHALLDGQRPS
jgi:hypothetical protein